MIQLMVTLAKQNKFKVIGSTRNQLLRIGLREQVTRIIIAQCFQFSVNYVSLLAEISFRYAFYYLRDHLRR